ncbi:MAG: DUF6064 family protein [Burkholderiales bacterium]
MSEWWTYSLSSFLLFSPATYYRLIELHNAQWWPAQCAALAAGATIFSCALRGGDARSRAALLLLAACWAWVAWAYHLDRYATINWAASYFGWAFAAQALLLAWTAARGTLRFASPPAGPARAGLAMCIVSLAGWPLLAPLFGRGWSQAEVFGFAPDPTALATLGILLAAGRMRPALFVIPLLWCALSGALLWAMRSPEAIAVPAAALAAIAVAAWRTIRERRQ